MAKRRPSGDGMVRKREDGRWEGRIVVGHKQNGEPIFRYVLAKTQKELLDKLHRDLEAFQDVELTEDSRMTLGEWLDRWMEDYGAATLRLSLSFIGDSLFLFLTRSITAGRWASFLFFQEPSQGECPKAEEIRLLFPYFQQRFHHSCFRRYWFANS